MEQAEKVETKHINDNIVAIFTSKDKDGSKCGTCTACCFVDPVVFPDHTKPPHTKCEYQTEKGCSNYEGRPDGCRCYGCSWLNGEVSDKYHPEKIGAVIETSEFSNPTFEGRQVLYQVAVYSRVKFFTTSHVDLVSDHPDVVWLITSGREIEVVGKSFRVKRLFSMLGRPEDIPDSDQFVAVQFAIPKEVWNATHRK